MNSIVQIFLVIFSFSKISSIENIDYCDKKMCPYQGIHVACNKTKTFSEDCEGETKIEHMTSYVDLILDTHNYYRNQVASGKVDRFYPAVRMPLLEWEWGLAETAEYNVRSCKFEHDECRSTEKFPMAGQNIYTTKTRRLNTTVDSFIIQAIFLWFEERLYADHELIKSYHRTNPQTGHFLLMIGDRQTRVGCAFLNNLLPEQKRFVIFTCNYASNNLHGIPSYKTGPAGSKCNKRNTKFEALCEDPIDANDLSWYSK